MRLGGRLAATIEILDAWLLRPQPLTVLLQDWARKNRFAGSGDRAAIGTLCHDALRRRGSAAALFGEENGRALALGGWLLQTGETPDALNGMLEGDRFAPDPISADEKAKIAAHAGPDLAEHDCPEWLRDRFARTFGSEWTAEVAGFSTRPPLDIRVNTLKSSPDKVAEKVAEFHPQPLPLPTGLRFLPDAKTGRLPNVTAEPLFQRGAFEVQDAGSQIAAAASGVAPGEQVLDFCAGAGGKTLAMAAMMDNRGQIHAYDIDRRRLSPLVERAKRAGVRNLQIIENAEKLEALSDRMDCVFVDAPCTGTGTWRRRPDIKWRLSEATLATQIERQADVLRKSAAHVRPGGRLIYVTCSVLPDENADQIASFLKERTDFTAEAASITLDRAFSSGKRPDFHESAFGLTLTPARSATDGFYLAVLRRDG